ncbi:hypothetical protein SLS64_011031 [Diaporthe eres]|uniref:Cytochrome P450 n=1 Tax=Diaporthe eres TaxID=83184 RepID=A0ABR1NYX8_DIAER
MIHRVQAESLQDILDFYIDWLMVQTIFELAARPEYVLPLREEIRTCVEEQGGFTKDGLNAMHKLDSFIREAQRWNPLDAGSMARRVMKPFTFKNGVHLRQGDWIFTPNSPLLEEDRFYDDASRFDGFRFARMREDPRLKLSCALTSTSEYNLQFGDGKHTCPGRFMASDEIKLMIAFFVMNYDVAFENMGSRPPNVTIGKFIFPDTGANVWVRPAKT